MKKCAKPKAGELKALAQLLHDVYWGDKPGAYPAGMSWVRLARLAWKLGARAPK